MSFFTDCTPGTPLGNVNPLNGSTDTTDITLHIGRTLSDNAAGIHITPVLRGADPDGTTWIDVTVNRGAYAGNRKPSVTMAASNLNPAVNASVSFTATATDPDGNTSEFSQRLIVASAPLSGPAAGGQQLGLDGMLFEAAATVPTDERAAWLDHRQVGSGPESPSDFA